MKFYVRLFLIICVFLIVLMSPYRALAESGSGPTGLSFSEILDKGNGFIDKGSSSSASFNATDLINGMANILTTIGIVVVLAGLLIMGIKYMTATPEEAAKLKTKLVGLFIAGIVIVGAYGIWHLVGFFLEGITTGHG